MSAKICVSILPKNIAEALELIGKAQSEGADFIEVRMDALEETRNLADLPKSTKSLEGEQVSPERILSGKPTKVQDSAMVG